jgi:hypothetical protein
MKRRRPTARSLQSPPAWLPAQMNSPSPLAALSVPVHLRPHSNLKRPAATELRLNAANAPP